MPIRSIRIPDDIEVKILEAHKATGQSINAVMVDGLRVGLDCPVEAELSDRVDTVEIELKDLKQKVIDIETRL
jgi:hypothetical protein